LVVFMTEKSENPSNSTGDQAHAPHSADDWEVLFEDPQNGLIAMIAQAHSLDALARSTRSTLLQLLVHEDERARLADYERRLAVIVGSDAQAPDIEQARLEIIALLRQLKEEGKRAAVMPDEGKQASEAKTAGRARRGPAARRMGSSWMLGLLGLLGLDGLQFSQVNKIGIITICASALLVIVVLAVYLRGPEMPAQEREAVAALLLAHGESARPEDSWEIESSRLGAEGKFTLVFQLGNARHISLFRSLSAMKRAKIAVDLCPRDGELLDKIAAYEKRIRIEIKQGGNVLTAASCP
jgi:hypothetical protein